jgi:hypothetical protein
MKERREEIREREEKIAREGSCKREEASGDAKTALGYAGQNLQWQSREEREKKKK